MFPIHFFSFFKLNHIHSLYLKEVQFLDFIIHSLLKSNHSLKYLSNFLLYNKVTHFIMINHQSLNMMIDFVFKKIQFLIFLI